MRAISGSFDLPSWVEGLSRAASISRPSKDLYLYSSGLMRADASKDLLNSVIFLGCWPAAASQISCGSAEFSPTKAIAPLALTAKDDGMQSGIAISSRVPLEE